jgi:hypothetical protein
MLAPDPNRRANSVDDALAVLRTKRKERPKAKRASSKRNAHLKREEERELRKEERRQRREAARERWERAHGGRAPLVPRLVAKFGLFVASMVVGLTVGVIVPLLLVVLSLVFGQALRRAARACQRAAQRSRAAMGRASEWLSSHRTDDAGVDEFARVRVEDEPARVRTVTEEDAQVRARVDDRERPFVEDETTELEERPRRLRR